MGRAPCCEKVGLKRGRWTAEEDDKLAKYIMAHGEGSWRSLPKNAGLLRCGKSCRLRWMNYLRADLKRGNISQEEEEIIIKLHSTFQNRWSLIAGHLPGRTDNEIKNYWNSHLSRRVHSFRKVGSDGETTTTLVLDSLLRSTGRRRGGKTSRRAMKKNLAGTSQKAKQDYKEGCSSDDGLSSLCLDPTHGISSITLDDLDQDLFQSDMGVEPPSAGGGEPQIENHDPAAVGERVEPDGTALATNVHGTASCHAEKASGAEKNEMLLDRELGGDAEDVWRWLWDVEDSTRELQVEGCDQHQVEYMASWLLSDVF